MSAADDNAPWFRWQNATLFLELTIQPGAAKSEIRGLHGDRLKLRIQAPPVDGKANRALTEYLAELFGVPRSHVEIVRGQTSRSKTVRIPTPANCPAALLALGLTWIN